MAMFLLPFPLLMIITLVRKLGTGGSVSVDYQHLFKRKDESPDLVCN